MAASLKSKLVGKHGIVPNKQTNVIKKKVPNKQINVIKNKLNGGFIKVQIGGQTWHCSKTKKIQYSETLNVGIFKEREREKKNYNLATKPFYSKQTKFAKLNDGGFIKVQIGQQTWHCSKQTNKYY